MLKIESFNDLVQQLEGASCKAGWDGRIVTLKNSQTIDLIELGARITALFVSRGCVAKEREALKSLNLKLTDWIKETDESLKGGIFVKHLDSFLYPSEIEYSSFWLPKSSYEKIENLYSNEDWEKEFPDVPMPEPIKWIDKFKLFSDKQIEEAKSEVYEHT